MTCITHHLLGRDSHDNEEAVAGECSFLSNTFPLELCSLYLSWANMSSNGLSVRTTRNILIYTTNIWLLLLLIQNIFSRLISECSSVQLEGFFVLRNGGDMRALMKKHL